MYILLADEFLSLKQAADKKRGGGYGLKNAPKKNPSP
jgi:hypothetical protein